MKKIMAFLLTVLTLLAVLSSCGPSAPAGMYAPEEVDTYIAGVSGIRFALPESYVITMSSNMLAGAGTKGDSFSIQCRHSNYRYEDGLMKNYQELKLQLVGQYGEFEEKLTEIKGDQKNPPMLRSDYELNVVGTTMGYTQYLFYDPSGEEFFLFTYAYDQGKADEALLAKVLSTIEFEEDEVKKTLPEGFKWVENATANSLKSSKYQMFCPDGWIWDNSLGASTMRIPSPGIISNLSLYEIPVGDDVEAFVSQYVKNMAPDLKDGESAPLEKYIIASLCRMNEDFVRFSLLNAEDSSKKVAISKENAIEKKNSYLQKYTNPHSVTFTYVDFECKMTAHTAHEDFISGNSNTAESVDLQKMYRFRQYYVLKDGVIYLFTYTSYPDRFAKYEKDVQKIIDNFVFLEA